MDFSGRFADRIMPDNIHKISLAPLVDTLSKQMGGTAGNIGYSLKLLGIEPLIQSTGGTDFEAYLAFLNDHHISTAYIPVSKKLVTGTYFVVTDKDDNQIGAFYKGALTENARLHLSDVTEEIDFVIIAPNDITAMKQYVSESRNAHKRYLFDPAFQIGDLTPEDLRSGIEGAEILIGNDYEIDLLQNKLEVTHEDLLVMGPKAVITTLGAKGSIVESRNDAIHIKPAKSKKVLDPTGAGDAYRSGFVSGYLRGFDLETCGRMGAVAAVYTVEKYGTVTHEYSVSAFTDRYFENYGSHIDLS
jgi:adenosine kinase